MTSRGNGPLICMMTTAVRKPTIQPRLSLIPRLKRHKSCRTSTITVFRTTRPSNVVSGCTGMVWTTQLDDLIIQQYFLISR